MKRIVAACISLITLASCTENATTPAPPSQPAVGIDTLAIETEVRQGLVQYFSDMEKDGLTAEFKYLDNSPGFFWVPPGHQSAISYDSVHTVLEKAALFYTRVSDKWDTLQVVVLDTGKALYTGRLTSILTDTSGITRQFQLLETGMVVRKDGIWKLFGGQTQVIPEAAGKK